MDEATLQRLREESGLRLDRQGRFLHRGEPVEHERTLRALHRGLHRAPDGRWATRIGSEWGYVDVEDAARFIRHAEPVQGRSGLLLVWLWGQDQDEAPLALEARGASLAVAGDGALSLRLPDGERALFLRPAQLRLADSIHEGEGGALFLDLGGARVAIGEDAGPEPVRVVSATA